MDVGQSNGWRLEDVVPAAELVEMIDAEFPLDPEAPGYPGEVATRWRYRDGAGEIGRDRVGDAAVLRRLHACAAVGEGRAVHVPVRHVRDGPAGAGPRQRIRRGDRGGDRRPLAASRRPVLGVAVGRDDRTGRDRPDCAGWRCSRSGAERPRASGRGAWAPGRGGQACGQLCRRALRHEPEHAVPRVGGLRRELDGLAVEEAVRRARVGVQLMGHGGRVQRALELGDRFGRDARVGAAEQAQHGAVHLAGQLRGRGSVADPVRAHRHPVEADRIR